MSVKKLILPATLGIAAPVAIITVAVLRSRAGKATDLQNKAAFTAAIILSAFWLARSKEARGSWLNRSLLALSGLGVAAVWLPWRSMLGGAQDTAALDAAARQADMPALAGAGVDGAAADVNLVAGTGALDALEKVLQSAKRTPDGPKVLDLYLTSTGVRRHPVTGEAVQTYQIEGPVGWYGDGSPQRMPVAVGMLRVDEETGGVEAGPFDWAPRVAAVLDGGYVRLTPTGDTPDQMTSSLTAILAAGGLPVKAQPRSGRMALTQTQDEVAQETHRAQTALLAQAAKAEAAGDLASISPRVASAINHPMPDEFWLANGGPERRWLSPLLIKWAAAAQSNRDLLAAALAPLLFHEDDRHVITLPNAAGGTDTQDVTAVARAVMTPEQLAAACPDCQAAPASASTKKAAVGNPNQSVDPGFQSAAPTWQQITMILQGYSGHANNYGLAFTVVDEQNVKLADGKLLNNLSQIKVEWPMPVAQNVTINAVQMPGLSLTSGTAAANALARWLRQFKGVNANASGTVSRMNQRM